VVTPALPAANVTASTSTAMSTSSAEFTLVLVKDFLSLKLRSLELFSFLIYLYSCQI
jgi:hypothetical protein